MLGRPTSMIMVRTAASLSDWSRPESATICLIATSSFSVKSLMLKVKISRLFLK